MAWLALGALSAGTGLALTYSRMTSMVDRWDDSLANMPIIGKVTILMPTLNEAATIQEAIASLRNQNVMAAYPEYFELVVVDSESTDDTVELAAALADQVITAPAGKLTAVTYAIDRLNSDIIVAVDADSEYKSNFLNLLLKHFEDPAVVAVSGVEIVKTPGPFAFFVALLEQYLHRLQPRMMGRGMAYRRSAFYETGGFDLSIDQKNVWTMMTEEEFGFHNRLSRIGKVVREYRASVLTTDRRLTCIVSPDSPYCQQIRSKQRM
jgi:glycosyltransferase involved in cell wall biosynthesis